jgi:hypothetical protein
MKHYVINGSSGILDAHEGIHGMHGAPVWIRGEEKYEIQLLR